MARIKLDPESIGLTLLLDKIAHVQAKDCFSDQETIYYVVPKGQVGKALGKAAVNIKKIGLRFNKKVKIIEYDENPLIFVKNYIYPLKSEEITQDQDTIFIKNNNKKAKSLLIGRGGKNLELLNRAVQRFFSKQVKII